MRIARSIRCPYKTNYSWFKPYNRVCLQFPSNSPRLDKPGRLAVSTIPTKCPPRAPPVLYNQLMVSYHRGSPFSFKIISNWAVPITEPYSNTIPCGNTFNFLRIIVHGRFSFTQTISKLLGTHKTWFTRLDLEVHLHFRSCTFAILYLLSNCSLFYAWCLMTVSPPCNVESMYFIQKQDNVKVNKGCMVVYSCQQEDIQYWEIHSLSTDVFIHPFMCSLILDYVKFIFDRSWIPCLRINIRFIALCVILCVKPYAITCK